MIRLCAWCGRQLEQAKPPDPDRTTHGICAKCKSKHFSPDEGKEREAVVCHKNGGRE